MKRYLLPIALIAASTSQAEISYEKIDQAVADVQPQVVEWRRWFHQNPELSNREFNTAARIAEILRGMGIDPRTGIAGTGLMAIIEGRPARWWRSAPTWTLYRSPSRPAWLLPPRLRGNTGARKWA